MSIRVFVVMIALLWVAAGTGQKAYAFGKHKSHPARVHKQKKNSSPYDYLSPKKQKKAKSYVSPVSGNVLYGEKKK